MNSQWHCSGTMGFDTRVTEHKSRIMFNSKEAPISHLSVGWARWCQKYALQYLFWLHFRPSLYALMFSARIIDSNTVQFVKWITFLVLYIWVQMLSLFLPQAKKEYIYMNILKTILKGIYKFKDKPCLFSAINTIINYLNYTLKIQYFLVFLNVTFTSKQKYK